MFGLFSACLLLSSLAFAKIEQVIGPVSLPQNQNLPSFIPETLDQEILISREQYVISYNAHRRSPNWVAWHLEAKNIGTAGRTNVFSKDPDLENYLNRTGEGTVVDTSEYNRSCFDRGHQVPSKDRTDNESNNGLTFLTSNIIPQTPYLNRVVWEHLEQYTRDLVQKQNKKVFVIDGPVYDEDFGMIGPHHDIPVPSKNFKIIYVLDAGESPSSLGPQTAAVAVLVPNVQKDGTPVTPGGPCAPSKTQEPENVDDWKQYVTTVDEIQKLVQLQFVSR